MLLGVFKNVEEAFLLVSHTHEGIDQAFSKNLNSLRSEDTVTLDEFQDVQRKEISGSADVVHMKRYVG